MPAQEHAAAETDAQLARLIAQGDRQALARLYARDSAAVYRYGLAMCGNPAWAADAMQEAFMQFIQQSRGYASERGALGGYLCGIARHLLLAQMREPQVPRREDDEDADPAAQKPAHTDGPLELLVARQSTEALLAAVHQLPLPFREALILVDLQEYDYAQAAQICGAPLNTLRTRLFRARKQLAQLLAPQAAANERQAHVQA
jgi:RNA polymerase sigma-70 factor (ECF subfamily)